MKIIQINGFKGILTALFIGVCAFAGFVVFPGACYMYLWNKYLVTLSGFPAIEVYQGMLLWGITVAIYLILNKQGFAVSFKETHELSDSEMNMIMKNARIYSGMKKINHAMGKADKFEKSSKNFNNNINDTAQTITTKNIEENEESVSNIK